jgi:hypothetical protein
MNIPKSPLAAGLLLVIWVSALGEVGARSADTGRVEQAWQRAVVAVGAAERIEDLRMPKVIFDKPPQGLARRGGEVRGAYNPFTNTATAMDYEALVHEFCHAALFQTEGLAAMRDEVRGRDLMLKAVEQYKGR